MTGNTAMQNGVTVDSGDQTWSKPSGMGDEMVVHIKRMD